MATITPSTLETRTKKLEDIDSGLLRQRRNLMVLSIGIILFELGGGSLSSVPLAYGSVTLNRPEVALYFIWLALPYSIWRYWLYRESAVAFFEEELVNAINASPIYRKLVKDTKESSGNDQKKLNNKYPIVIQKVFRRYLDFDRSIRSEEKVGPNLRKLEIATYGDAPIIKVSFLKVLPIELYAFFQVMIKNRGFTDYCLPYLFGYIAIGLIIINHIVCVTA